LSSFGGQKRLDRPGTSVAQTRMNNNSVNLLVEDEDGYKAVLACFCYTPLLQMRPIITL
jgi:hypothetical protein